MFERFGEKGKIYFSLLHLSSAIDCSVYIILLYSMTFKSFSNIIRKDILIFLQIIKLDDPKEKYRINDG